MSFIAKLNQVVEDLKSNPDIEIIHYNVLPPNPDQIAEVEQKLGYSLHKSITDFYKECGGVSLFWVNKEINEDADWFIKNKTKLPKINNAYFIKSGDIFPRRPDGSIIIPSMKEVFTYDWSSLIYDAEDTISEYKKAIKAENADEEKFRIQVLDYFDDFNDAAFLLTGNSNPYIVLGDDNQACYTDSKLFTFAQYLDLLIKTKGHTANRVDAMKKP